MKKRIVIITTTTIMIIIIIINNNLGIWGILVYMYECIYLDKEKELVQSQNRDSSCFVVPSGQVI